MSKQKMKAEGTVEMAEVIGYLEDILNGLKSGQMFIEHGGDQIVLTPGSAAEVEIEAKQKEGKQELSFEFEWKRNVFIGRKLDLKISSAAESRAMFGGESSVSASEEEVSGVHPEEELRVTPGLKRSVRSSKNSVRGLKALNHKLGDAFFFAQRWAISSPMGGNGLCAGP